MVDLCARLDALIAGDTTGAAREALLAHAAACAACSERLTVEAPELLLAALSVSIPDAQPLEAVAFSRALPARRPPWFMSAAAAAAVLIAALLAWRVGTPERARAPVEIAASAAAPAFVPEPEPDAPVVESGAEQFVVREFTAPGFDGREAQWVVLSSEAAVSDEVRS